MEYPFPVISSGGLPLKVNYGETIINGKSSGTSLILPLARKKTPGGEAGGSNVWVG
jgi:hypothetical protein